MLEKLSFNFDFNAMKQHMEVYDALLIAEMKTNPLSVARIGDKRCTVMFKEEREVIKNSKENVILISDHKNDLCYLRRVVNINYSATYIASKLTDSVKNICTDLKKWHCRMVCINLKDIM